MYQYEVRDLPSFCYHTALPARKKHGRPRLVTARCAQYHAHSDSWRSFPKFHGSMVALVTPLHAAERLDASGLARLVEFHIEQGTDALVAVGTTGEAATLDMDEHCRVIRQVVEFARGRGPVIAGTGSI